MKVLKGYMELKGFIFRQLRHLLEDAAALLLF